jgi:hypothetical protein
MAIVTNPNKPQSSKNPTATNEPLIDRDSDIFDPALSFPDLCPIIHNAQTNANNDQDYLHLWESNLVNPMSRKLSISLNLSTGVQQIIKIMREK